MGVTKRAHALPILAVLTSSACGADAASGPSELDPGRFEATTARSPAASKGFAGLETSVNQHRITLQRNLDLIFLVRELPGRPAPGTYAIDGDELWAAGGIDGQTLPAVTGTVTITRSTSDALVGEFSLADDAAQGPTFTLRGDFHARCAASSTSETTCN